MNIRNQDDCKSLAAQGWKFVTVRPRGDNKGGVMSKHRTRDAAEKAARGKDRSIEEVHADLYWQS